MESRNLGTQGLSVAAIGLGCMRMTHAYGTRDDAEAIATIHRALDAGVTLLDTAEVYGLYTNEELVGKAIRGRHAQVSLATKFGIKMNSDGVASVDGTPANARRAVEGSLKRARCRRHRSLLPAPEGSGRANLRRQYLNENLGAVEVKLDNKDLADLNPLASIVSGERYPTHAPKLAER